MLDEGGGEGAQNTTAYLAITFLNSALYLYRASQLGLSSKRQGASERNLLFRRQSLSFGEEKMDKYCMLSSHQKP